VDNREIVVEKGLFWWKSFSFSSQAHFSKNPYIGVSTETQAIYAKIKGGAISGRHKKNETADSLLHILFF
jgi:hypothetical protein